MSWPNRKWKQPRKRFPYRRCYAALCAAEPYAERKMAIVGAAWAVPGNPGAGILRRGRVRPATAVLRLRGAGRVGLCPPLLRRPCLLRGRRMTELAQGEGILKRYAPQYPASGAGRACPGRRSRRLVSSSWTVRRSCGEGISALSAAKMPRRPGPRPPAIFLPSAIPCPVQDTLARTHSAAPAKNEGGYAQTAGGLGPAMACGNIKIPD